MTTNVVSEPARSHIHWIAKCAIGMATILAVLVAAGRAPRPASAAFHTMVIDEVMAGVPGDPTVQFVEIKETAAGQNLVSGKQIVVYDATGANVGTFTFPANVANGANLARILIATPSAAAYYGITADLPMTPVMTATGMVCYFDPGFFQNIDCVPYKNYSQPNILKPPATSNGAGNGYASLTRVATSTKTALDFALLCPTPQNNANVIGAPPASDPDADGVNGGGGCADNCPTDSNPGQANNDKNVVDLPPSKPYDDMTAVNSDNIGDACDPDNDNDGLLNTDELNLGPAGSSHALCPTASANTDPLLVDTDGDRIVDSAECALGSDPADPASKPAPPVAGTDPDHDGLSSAFEATIGTDPSKADTDGDGVTDGVEFKVYASNPLNINTDGDFCGDGKEIATVDQNQTVNSTDLQQVAVAFGPNTSPGYILDFDMDKNGTVNSTDLQFVATKFGSCP